MNKILKLVFISFLSFTPIFAFAALAGIKGLIGEVGEIIKLLIPIVVGIALLVFFWGLAKLIFKANDQKAREEGRAVMVWGLVALFVMISVWGIVGFIQDQLDLPMEDGIEAPDAPPVQWPPQQA